jgi:lipopolysaccharide export system protein LptA
MGPALSLLALSLAPVPVAPPSASAQAGTVTTVTVERGERTITVVQRALAADGARSILNNPNCEPEIQTHLFVGPPPGFVETTIDATRLTSSIARIRVPAGEGDETIELLRGTASVDRPGCLEAVEERDAEPVTLEQGRTVVLGTRFWLEQDSDLALLDGPVTLTRQGEGGVALEASAASLTLDVRTEAATLEGEVVVTSDERVTRADRLELDEQAGVALLTGAPAISVRGDEEVRGSVLRYDLETDEVVALGAVGARFEVDLDGR